MKLYSSIKQTIAILVGSILATVSVYGQNLVIDPTQKGSIRIHKYAVDNPEDFDEPATGEEQTVNNLDPLPNIEFTVTRVQDDASDPLTASPLVGEGAYSKSLSTEQDGTAYFTELNQGVYLVAETANPSVTAPVDDFLVSIPMTNPLGTGWLMDVNVYPKNQLIPLPRFGMSISEPHNMSAPASLGDTLSWYVTAEIPNDIASAQEYKVSCGLNSFLTYMANSIQVYVEAENSEQTTLVINEDYVFTNDGNQLELVISDEGKVKLAGLITNGSTDTNPLLTMEYHTVFHGDSNQIEEVMGTKIYNTATFFYTNAIGIPYTASIPEEALPYIYSGGLNITKIDGKTELPLSGASFKLFTSPEDAKNGTNPVQNPTQAEDWEVTTDKDGKAYFYGLSYGNLGDSPETGTSTYYLVETLAPAGYNLLRSPAEAVVDMSSHLDGNTVTIQDYSGFTLPVTGGMGTFLFTAAGLLLIGLACVMLFYTMRKNKVKYKK